MASPRTHRNPTCIKEDKLAGSVLTKSCNTPLPFPAIFLAQTPALAQTSTPAQVFILALPGMYTNIDLERANKVALALFIKGQKYNKANFAPWNGAFKARNPDLYYGSSYIECYYSVNSARIILT